MNPHQVKGISCRFLRWLLKCLDFRVVGFFPSNCFFLSLELLVFPSRIVFFSLSNCFFLSLGFFFSLVWFLFLTCPVSFSPSSGFFFFPVRLLFFPHLAFLFPLFVCSFFPLSVYILHTFKIRLSGLPLFFLVIRGRQGVPNTRSDRRTRLRRHKTLRWSATSRQICSSSRVDFR